MSNDLLAFALTTANAHIAVVKDDYKAGKAHFIRAQEQLKGFTERIYPLEQKLRLINGTVIYFIDAMHYERLRGLRLDRIETTLVALRTLPNFFLETRLKPGIMPDEAITFRR